MLLLSIIIQILLVSCINNRTPIPSEYKSKEKHVEYAKLGEIDNNVVIVSKEVDLSGAICSLPPNYTLEFKGGIIKNGTLVGDNTKIKGSESCFNRVSILGTWNVPEISTRLFDDLSYDNALRDVVALINPNVQNRVVIEEGEYQVSVTKDKESCISLCSNTDFVLNGVVRLVPNNFKSYYIIQAKGDNIKIRGKGVIIGDKHTHIGSEGEWGMGVFLRGANNSSIRDITIKDCWGDCIYIGGNSKNVLVDNCVLDHGRRQGISITKADGITIRNCKITNVSGTNPQYAILLEPNSNCSVDHVVIENVEVKNCIGGIASTKLHNEESRIIGDVQVRNCKLSVLKKNPIKLNGCEDVTIERCTVDVRNYRSAILTDNSKHVVIKDNTINVTKRIYSTIENTVNKVAVGRNFKPIEVISAESQNLYNNRIVEK